MDASQARTKAKALVAQAMDDSVTAEEARSHAFAAVKLIAKWDLLDEAGLGSVIGAVASPEMGEVISSVVDLGTRIAKSGLADAIKRTVGSTRRAAAASRRGRGVDVPAGEGRRRRHGR